MNVYTEVTLKVKEAMLTFPDKNIENKAFYMKITSDGKEHSTRPAKGSNPKWNEVKNVTINDNQILFQLFEKKTGLLASDKEKGSFTIKFYKVKAFKISKNYEIKNNNESVGTLDLTLRIKTQHPLRRGFRGEQGSKIEFLHNGSRSVSLENEEEEYEDEPEGEDLYEVYENEHMMQQKMRNINIRDKDLVGIQQIDTNRDYRTGKECICYII